MKSSTKAFLLLNYISIGTSSSAAITPALPEIETYYHLGYGSLEWVVTLFLIGYVVGQLIYGPLANRMGRLGALRLGLYVNLGGIILCIVAYYAHLYQILLLGRFITALGAAGGLVCSFILINESFDQTRQRRTLSYAIISFTLGIALAVFLGGLITEAFGWVYCFVLLFLHGGVLLYLLRFLDETLPLNQRRSQNMRVLVERYRYALAQPKCLLFGITMGFVSTFAYTFSAAAPNIAHQLLTMTPGVYGSWNLLNSVGMLLGGLCSARLGKKLSAMQLIYIGFIGFGLCMLSLIIFARVDSTNAVWFFGTTASTYLMTSLIYASAAFFASNATDDKASAAAISNFLNLATATLAVAVLGYLPMSMLGAFVCINIIFLLSTLTLLILGKVGFITTACERHERL